MSGKIKVEVFGIKDQSAGGGCSCSGGCGPVKTMWEMYDEFADFLSNSNVKDRIETKFIDVLMDDLDGYESVKNAMERGYSMPLTAINGKLKFYGGISNKMVYAEIKKAM